MSRIDGIKHQNNIQADLHVKKASHKKASGKEEVSLGKDGFEKSRNVFTGIKDKIKGFWAKDILGKASGGMKAKAADMDFTTKAAIAGGGIGAVAGGIVGYQAGKLEAASTQVSHETWQVPITERQNLGNIPSDYYSPTSWWGGWDMYGDHVDHVHINEAGNIVGGQPVYRDVPVYNPDGTIKMQTVTKDISSQRFGPTSGAIGGAILGGVGGVAGGIAVGLLHKLATGK
ncbi:MAG: hypothetical protein M1269_05010 [Chloroflexi bacterium]|nr:hypothetical protein [Chloroflexota bacterium]